MNKLLLLTMLALSGCATLDSEAQVYTFPQTVTCYNQECFAENYSQNINYDQVPNGNFKLKNGTYTFIRAGDVYGGLIADYFNQTNDQLVKIMPARGAVYQPVNPRDWENPVSTEIGSYCISDDATDCPFKDNGPK